MAHLKSKWDDRFYVLAYELARSGLSDGMIARNLGINPATLKEWKVRRPALAEALERARSSQGENPQATFRDYVYARLPAGLQELWDRINRYEQVDDSLDKVEEILKVHGTATRQHLFLYALVHCSFNPTEACRKVNIPRSTLQSWAEDDPDFGTLLREIDWHKGNFFEAALVEKVREGDPICTIFANKTFNRSRGYAEKVDVSVQGSVTHQHLHAQISLEELDLPLEVRKAILRAVQEKRERESPRLIEHREVDP